MAWTTTFTATLPRVLVLAVLLLVLPAKAETIAVVDGDTVRVNGATIRLVGLNAPESSGRALCERERRLGAIAKARLRQILERGPVELRLIPCACKPGTEGTDDCNYGRACGVLTVNGRDVAGLMIAEGLAVSFRCGTSSCPRLPRPWCP